MEQRKGYRLRFEVVYCSSAQPGFEAELLANPFKRNGGWRTEKFPLYPCEIILRLTDHFVHLHEV